MPGHRSAAPGVPAVFQSGPSQRDWGLRGFTCMACHIHSLRAGQALLARGKADMHTIEDLAWEVLVAVEATSFRTLIV